ncbi:hypothetical protein SISSUDRAFT_1054242 [Sistotremastrum suecicum HHB10207 ss-3]|uniref:Uncharacterized protein n=1 Tax=Sistotremastrum suecicum HHB10207 ss-3 TaxID=1314776 RepID=A0A165YN72_9AGAM|nr:hypothetical protein SISSUDRAFT_1054242 [Sistotremastrum suecicum HHB10207 ss-3]
MPTKPQLPRTEVTPQRWWWSEKERKRGIGLGAFPRSQGKHERKSPLFACAF